MRILIPIVVVIVSLPLASRAQQKQLPWELMGQDEGIRVYKRDVPGSPLGAFKGEAVFNAPMDRVFSAILDRNHKKEWVDMLDDYKQLAYDKAKIEVTEYIRVDVPWPVSDRDFVTKSTATYNAKTQTIRMYSTATTHPLAPENDKAIRGQTHSAHLVLKRLASNRTAISMDVHADPGGFLPNWVINFAQRDWPHNTLSKLRKLSKRKDIAISPIYNQLMNKANKATLNAD